MYKRQLLSVEQIINQVHSLSNFFISNGIKEGDRIAGYLSNIPEGVIAALAASNVGAIWSSCSPDFGVDSAVDRFIQISPKMLFTSDQVIQNGEFEELNIRVNDIVSRITEIEKNLYQTKNRSGQDPLNFPIRLNNKLAHLSSVASRGNYKPTDQMYGVRDELVKLIDVELQKWKEIKSSELDKINTMILENNIQLISIN